MPAKEQTYKTLIQSWDGSDGTIKISTPGPDSIIIAELPLSFLQSSNSNTWDYIQYTVQLCVNDQGTIVSEGDKVVSSLDVPSAGSYTFVSSTGVLTFRPGPEGKSKMRPPTGTSVSTWSNSARSSTNQSAFRLRVGLRDFNCLLSGADFDQCIASHLIPYSRPDIWERYGIRYPFTASCGILLASGYHTLFDKYHWSFYDPEDGTLIVHYFAPANADQIALHGKIIPRERFRINLENELPDRRFLQWHYQQCVLFNMRGTYVEA